MALWYADLHERGVNYVTKWRLHADFLVSPWAMAGLFGGRGGGERWVVTRGD